MKQEPELAILNLITDKVLAYGPAKARKKPPGPKSAKAKRKTDGGKKRTAKPSKG